MEGPVTRLMSRHLKLTCCSFISAHSYFFEADFQVVLWLLLIILERFIDQKLLFNVDLENNKNVDFYLLWFVPSGEWLIWHSRIDCRVLGGEEEFSNTTSDLSTENCKNSPANMVYCDCCQVKPKPLLWLMESLLDGWLLLFYPPPVLPIGQRNCPPAPFDPLGSFSPGTPSASLAADKSVQITNSQNEWIWKRALMFFWFFTLYTDDMLFSSSVLL